MKLLILTQAVRKNDPVLGFFHRWLEELAGRFEKVTVIALGAGEHDLPENVKVLSLGKEHGASKLEYLWKFYTYLWRERREYDAVFVHMNQEYVLLAGCLWRLMGKRVYLWRNHAKGSLATRLAVALAHKVFYTSPSSYTARFRKAVRMPAGIDTDFFKPDPAAVRKPHSILFLGRISSVKRVLEFVEWFNALGGDYTATVAGEALPKDKEYEALVRSKASPRITFIGAVTQDEALRLYQTHETYVNKTPAGSFDKTIVEAAACGMKLMVDNPDAENVNPAEHSLKLLGERLARELSS
ncbi:glycosyltransferase [Candidatus Parcubacteria bacterium]|nr:glycosyltransferase [Candidatus Parcubacteria bacterium]